LGHAPSVRDLARVHQQVGDLERALGAWHHLVAIDPGDASAWVAIAQLSSTERTEALQRALEADSCQVDALLLRAGEISGCVAVPWAERAVDAAPLVPEVLEALGAAYHACGVDLRHRGDLAGMASQVEGLRQVERTWWVLGEEGTAQQVAAKRRALQH